MQVEFLTELFTLAKSEGIHTCIDTSGITFNPSNLAYIAKLDRLMELVDLVMLDIKHIDSEGHKALTGQDNANTLAFAKF
jgi:pyruvate formate lyase activating enzyme